MGNPQHIFVAHIDEVEPIVLNWVNNLTQEQIKSIQFTFLVSEGIYNEKQIQKVIGCDLIFYIDVLPPILKYIKISFSSFDDFFNPNINPDTWHEAWHEEGNKIFKQIQQSHKKNCTFTHH